ncbi:hypothetical protein DAPPUDRAFT_345695 [Daphnia pulex]|uniref:Uncharacterized protein n=1 Tax=Daphnia pulex TaxID=6669 RepID=E9I7J3_DAPPU|nr:hypothetical protein DAPPUDRAFT_345695 [Daphnia pulex]|eukprot:EFX60037.1 hypothetical protein DAPPUDRAFT_345695 [Daphnia pulex]
MSILLANDDQAGSPSNNSSSLDQQYTTLNVTTPSHNGDPIPHRSSSESNLLLDALQTISTTSPKLPASTHHFLNSMLSSTKHHNNDDDDDDNTDNDGRDESRHGRDDRGQRGRVAVYSAAAL